MQTRPNGIDAGQATIIVDRCVPPDGLPAAPATLKAVLWCLRGLGGPGADLCVHQAEIERRTCLKARTVGKAMATLREHGIIQSIGTAAPGRPVRYRVDYARLADWLTDPQDRAAAGFGPHPNKPGNVGTTCRRSPAPDADDRRHQMPTSGASSAPGAPNVGTRCRRHIKENSCKDLQENSGGGAPPMAAAAAGSVRVEAQEWATVARRAGLEAGLAGQCAEVLVSLGITDAELARNALERLDERVRGGGIRNPLGLLRSLLASPGGPEASQRELSRRRARESQAKREREFGAFLHNITRGQEAAIRPRLLAVLERHPDDAARLAPGGVLPAAWYQESDVREWAFAHWDEIRNMQGVAA